MIADRPLLGIGFMLGFCVLAPLGDSFAKLLGGLVPLGQILLVRFAVQALLRTDEPIGRLRGRVHQYQGVPLVVTYHPAYLLRNPADKAKTWEDIQEVMQKLAE